MEKDNIHRILVVDDEPAILALIERQLSELPFIVIPTSSPAEAIFILKSRDISVLLCDINMPGIDGNVVLNIAREANPNVVSIVITGAADQTATIRAINEGGIWKFIVKPWEAQELVKLVSDAAKHYATRRRQQAQLERLAQDITTPVKGEVVEVEEEDLDIAGDRFKLVEVLGEGGAGTVYRAIDQLLEMPVAIKVLGSRFSRDRLASSTLKAEARIAMQLSHRHIVRIHNLQKVRGRWCLVMEFVEGRTLRELLQIHGALPLETVLQIVRVCADALQYAHRHGVVHRDLKPTNLLLDERGVLKIIDFGVSCLIGAHEEGDAVIGTPIYMSPEQLRGEPIDHRTDIYSLGIIVYEMLTGQPPFPRDETDAEVLANGPDDLSDIPDEIQPVLAKALARSRRDRWDSAQAFSDALMEAAAPLLA